jgi:hypothetical protein
MKKIVKSGVAEPAPGAVIKLLPGAEAVIANYGSSSATAAMDSAIEIVLSWIIWTKNG